MLTLETTTNCECTSVHALCDATETVPLVSESGCPLSSSVKKRDSERNDYFSFPKYLECRTTRRERQILSGSIVHGVENLPTTKSFYRLQRQKRESIRKCYIS